MNPAAIYQDNAVTTQSRGRLVVLLYDGAIKFLKLAIAAINNGNYADKGLYISKSQNIINELNTTLDMEIGGEIAQNLRQLYQFMGRHLNEANMESDPKKAQEVIDLLEELNQGWRAIADQNF